MKRARGFTLPEVLIGASISLAAISAVTAVFISQNRAFLALDLSREASESARDAFLELEPALRRAGYGIDPRYAFDFAYYWCPASPCRDSTSAPDHLVFYARNPNYLLVNSGSANPDGTTCATSGGCTFGNAFHLTNSAPTAAGATLNLPAGVALQRGRILLFACANPQTTTMATVAAAARGPGAVSVSFVSGTDPYRKADFSDPCFSSGYTTALAFLVDRYHYFVQSYGGVPWLVLDQGLDLNGDGTTPDAGDANDLVPVAQGIEDLQVSYVLNVNAPAVAQGGAAPAAPPGNGPDLPTAGGANAGNWVIADYGTGSGATFTGQVEEPDSTIANMPVYTTSLSDSKRFNTTVANIRGVRIFVGVRSVTTDTSAAPSWTGDVARQAMNRSASTLSSGGRFRRYAFFTAVDARSMESRNPFLF